MPGPPGTPGHQAHGRIPAFTGAALAVPLAVAGGTGYWPYQRLDGSRQAVDVDNGAAQVGEQLRATGHAVIGTGNTPAGQTTVTGPPGLEQQTKAPSARLKTSVHTDQDPARHARGGDPHHRLRPPRPARPTSPDPPRS